MADLTLAATTTTSPDVATTINRKVRVGNRTVVLLGGVEVGLIQSFRASDDYSPEPASGIGSIQVVEYVPTVARHTITVSQMVLITQNLRMSKAAEENGTEVVKGNIFDIEVYDAKGALLRKYKGCSYASGDIEVSAHKIVVSNATFNALDVSKTNI